MPVKIEGKIVGYEVARPEDVKAAELAAQQEKEERSRGKVIRMTEQVQRPEGLVFFVFVAPDRDFQNYDDTFQSMLNSVRFR